VSLAGSFYNVGPGERPGTVIIFLGVEMDDLDPGSHESLALADPVINRWGVPEERDEPILVYRKPRMTGRPHCG